VEAKTRSLVDFPTGKPNGKTGKPAPWLIFRNGTIGRIKHFFQTPSKRASLALSLFSKLLGAPPPSPIAGHAEHPCGHACSPPKHDLVGSIVEQFQAVMGKWGAQHVATDARALVMGMWG
jgi:hypothetical protein